MNSSSSKTIKESLVDFFQSVVIALAIALFIYLFIITPSEVDGSSMEPTFYTGERLYTNKLTRWFNGTELGQALGLDYARGDIIVFQKPGMEMLIKRVIALPGEVIELRDGRFYINGTYLQEDYINSSIMTKEGTFLKNDTKTVIPEGSYFIAGDNRAVSNDSRFIGFIKEDWIVGKPIFRIWPLDKIGIINN